MNSKWNVQSTISKYEVIDNKLMKITALFITEPVLSKKSKNRMITRKFTT